MAEELKTAQSKNNHESSMVINGVHYRVKSVFNNKVTIEKALVNIAKRKITESIPVIK